MSRTMREYKGKLFREKTKKKLKKTKFFGWPEHKWARGNGPQGYKFSYGHFSGHSPLYPKHIYKRKKEEVSYDNN